ncbi:hypothetical protein chiPu_0002555 [Chiloscyllium punctatum]|uniref:Uncharacterized protein n=1 Tax=Chiloscyllium punctatum TaxID=137246 RepID=A0A401S192_CHIPU|nr:hypothetical protein [Chiloscyllium punctatum]
MDVLYWRIASVPGRSWRGHQGAAEPVGIPIEYHMEVYYPKEPSNEYYSDLPVKDISNLLLCVWTVLTEV